MHNYARRCQYFLHIIPQPVFAGEVRAEEAFALHCRAVRIHHIVLRDIVPLLALLAFALPCPAQERLQDVVDAAMRGLRPHQGTAVVLDLRTNTIIAARDIDIAARRVATPGSTVKSFVLLTLLETGKAKASERYACPRRVRIAGRRLDCTHPELPGPIDPMDALAWSCNAYFAMAARRVTPADLAGALRRSGLTSATGLAENEALGNVKTAASDDELELQALGEWGVMTTPLELLKAYAGLAQRLDAGDANVRLVWEGLEHSVAYGMARAARVDSVKIAGKTGTAAQPGSVATHGWFVGIAPADKPEIVVVVYLERGRGLDAAALAQPILRSYFAGRR
jgi:cell division protein FtsI/penicillin-binding protein 2